MDLTKISKKLSYLLRHSTDPLYIRPDGGWADVGEIIYSNIIYSNQWSEFIKKF